MVICRRCGTKETKRRVDGSLCDGLPGLPYWQCPHCGHAWPIRPAIDKSRIDRAGKKEEKP